MDAYVIHTKRYIIYNTYIRELIHPLIILKVPSLIIIDHNFYLVHDETKVFKRDADNHDELILKERRMRDKKTRRCCWCDRPSEIDREMTE